jgi:hypothetical protein
MITTICDVSINVQQTVEKRTLADNISAYKITRSCSTLTDIPKWFGDLLQERVIVGIARDSDIQDFVDSKISVLCNDLELEPPEFLEFAQRFGYSNAMDKSESDDHIKKIKRSPIDAPDDWVLVRNGRSNHMLFDIDGRPLPIALRYDYMDGIRDGYYDIERMVEFLRPHRQIYPMREDDWIEVLNVPYYNVSEGCSKYCQFIFSPTQEQMIAIWEEAKRIGGNYPSTRLREAVFNLDLIGLRKAGISKSDNYCD